jgi:hypothetical protein
MGSVAAPVVTMEIGKIGECICIAPQAGASGKVEAAAVRTSTTWSRQPALWPGGGGCLPVLS